MSRGKVTLCFFVFCWIVLSTILVPGIFRFFNRIEPWVMGLPFVQFWILTVIVLLSVTYVAWYWVERKRGELE